MILKVKPAGCFLLITLIVSTLSATTPIPTFSSPRLRAACAFHQKVFRQADNIRSATIGEIDKKFQEGKIKDDERKRLIAAADQKAKQTKKQTRRFLIAELNWAIKTQDDIPERQKAQTFLEAITGKKQKKATAKNHPRGKYCLDIQGSGLCNLGTPKDMLNSSKATYSFWLNPHKAMQTGNVLWDGSEASSHDRHIRYKNGQIQILYDWKPQTRYTHSLSGGNVKAGQWTHVAVTLNNNVTTIYINGQQVAQSKKPIAPHASTSSIMLGCCQHRGKLVGKQYNGLVGDVTIWDRPLNADEIVKMYKGKRMPKTGLLCQWTFAEPKVVNDKVGKLKDLEGYKMKNVEFIKLK